MSVFVVDINARVVGISPAFILGLALNSREYDVKICSFVLVCVVTEEYLPVTCVMC